ncbi:MAG: hypothetical protein JOY68_02680 [Candidatus Dormibacteraeota bacterium]|nr:hypothetical protein [Candidatus Dormibacteraeota bacterium]MBV8445117.1 hypothetical protein [Candidatus Dormibacteraeota bacterium]
MPHGVDHEGGDFHALWDHLAPRVIDERTLRRLLDGYPEERSATGRAFCGDVLETLCAIVLELEVTERGVGAKSVKISRALAELRAHVCSAAETLRMLSETDTLAAENRESIRAFVTRVVARHGAAFDTHLAWIGGDPERTESGRALVWVVDELLHHLRSRLAGSASLDVDTSDGVEARLSTPSGALAVHSGEPEWLLRCRLRLALAAGSIQVQQLAEGTCVEILLP